jgi:thioredoxin reductase (NADPH)
MGDEPVGAAARPALVAVDDDPAALARIADELRRRYAADYEVVCATSAREAQEALEEIGRRGGDVAIVLAAQWLPDVTGDELLARAHRLYPRAKRGLLVDFGAWGDRATADAILRAMTHGHIDYYVLRPWRSCDELFHRTITEFLHEWSRTETSTPKEVVVVGDAWEPRANEITTLLGRNGVPTLFRAADSPEGTALLARAGRDRSDGPVVFLLDGSVLVRPTNVELARAYGVTTELDADHEVDVAVVGAGPAGLSAAVAAASEGLSTLVVERESIGGQAGSSSMIRNYPGFSRGIGGAELAQRAYQQAWVFGARFVLMREIVELSRHGDQHTVMLSDGSSARARAVVLATGVSYRRLGIPTLEELVGAGVFYGGSISELHALAGEEVYVVGGGNSAGQAALNLARYADRVTIVVRGASLEESMSQYLLAEIAAKQNVRVLTRTELVDGGGDGRLEWVALRDLQRDETGETPAAAVFVLVGAAPRSDWLPDTIARDRWGFVLTGADIRADEAADARWLLRRDPLPYETTDPGVFAVGDIRHGSVKRVASAVGEASVAIRQVHDYLASLDRDRLASA